MKLQQLMGIAFGLCLSGTLYTSAQTQLTDYVDPVSYTHLTLPTILLV